MTSYPDKIKRVGSFFTIFIGFLFFILNISISKVWAQNLPAISEISYGLIDGELIPMSKRTFKHLSEQILLETIEFQNTVESKNPQWEPFRKRTNFFDDTGRRIGGKSIFYFRGENSGKISYISENRQTYNELDLRVRDFWSATSYDESGTVISFEAGRVEIIYDENQCEVEFIDERNTDINLAEENWKIVYHTFRNMDRNCEIISEESYVDGVLNSTYVAERNNLGLLTYEENQYGLADTFGVYRQIRRMEYNSRGQLIYSDQLIEDPGITYRFETFYSYNRIGLEDTIKRIFTHDFTVEKTMEILEYDRSRNLIKSIGYEYDTLGNRYLSFTLDRSFNEDNQLIYSRTESCSIDGKCRIHESTTTYRDDGQVENRLTHSVQTEDDVITSEWTSNDVFIYNCAGQIVEEIYDNGNDITSKREFYYPLSPDCEGQPEESSINIIPNPAQNNISLISRFLNGKETEVSIYTTNGERVFSTPTDNEFYFNALDLNLPTGSYILQLFRGELNTSERLIIVNE